MPGKQSPTLVPFGPFEADLHSQELRKQGVRLRLPRQSFQILKMLLERPGQLVTREELRQALWPSDTFVDFEHGLNAAINRLREALGDDADNPRYIETLPRRGYRLVATRASDAIQAEKRQPPARRWGLPLIATAVLVSAVALFALDAGGLRSKLLSSSSARPQIRSLAVLPLINLSGDPEQEYFADGMTEELITELSRIGSLRVISRSSVMQYKGERKKSLSQIGRELNVDAILEGAILRSDNRVRITAHMIYAPTDQNLMAETYERDLGDILRLQSQVAQSVAQRVQVQFTPEQQARLRSAPVTNPEAYEAYLKGRFYGSEATGTRAAFKQAQGYYEDAVRKDPTLALAYAGLADCYVAQGTFRLVPPQEAYRQASAAIQKALQLDQALGEAHSSLGYLDWQFAWDWQTAEKELRYGVQLNPNSMQGHEALVWYLAWSGRRDEALAEVEKMRRIDPAFPFIAQEGTGVYYHQREYKSLVEAGEKSVAAYPNGWPGHYFLAVGYEGSGQPAQAIPEYQRAVELSEANPDAIAGLAHAYVASGKRNDAEKILHEMQEKSKTGYVSPYMIGAIYATLGSKDKAFEFLEKAYKEKSPDVAYFLKADLRIDPLRSDPRFQDLLRRMNFPQ